MTRYKASAIHFAGSACVLLLIFILVRWIWYPGPLFFAAGGADLTTIIAAVDVILGPLIMLIIFNPKKSSLKFDIACVLACQIGFMLYGTWSIFSARPVYVAFAKNSFHLVTANQIDGVDQKKAQDPRYQAMPWFGPAIVGTKEPADRKAQEDILFGGVGGMGIQNLPQYFTAYTDVMAQAKAAAKAVSDLPQLPDKDGARLNAFQATLQAQNKQTLFIKMPTRKKVLYVAVDAASGAFIAIL
jgi:hypothetical protein